MHKQQTPFQVGTKTTPGTWLFLFWFMTAAALIQTVITALPSRTQAPSRRTAGPAANARAAQLKSSLWGTEWGRGPGFCLLHPFMEVWDTPALLLCQ